MKFTLSWLKEHLITDASLDEIVETMIRVGLEVEEVINPADSVSEITVGHVVSAEKHPDADKLKVCRVKTKEGVLQIVCGAPNAREGIYVAFAPVGTYVPGIDVTLSKAKIRGVESNGMMCSARELELGQDHDGIIELPEAAVGTPIADLLGLDDPVIDFEVTPNRPDTNGVDGVARDLAAAGLGTLRRREVPQIAPTFDAKIAIEIDDLVDCPAFAARLVRNVRNGPSPQWLQDRLRAVGLRPINALVDIANFISYDSARPLHVYDADKLAGSIRARRGREGESFLALDGKDYAVDDTMIVIADDEKVLGLGGIMGGESSGCTEETTDVLIESALFDSLTIARTGRKTGIVSDARYRFERGVDPATVLPGLDRAAQMVLELCGGEVSDVCLAGTIPDEKKNVEFPPSEVMRLTGLDVSDSEKERILTELGFEVHRGGLWSVKVPTNRPDIEGKADLVEEIARIHGLDHLPTSTLPPLEDVRMPAPPQAVIVERAVRSALTSVGFHEAVTWAFCDSGAASLFGGEATPKLSNPISSELGQMRPTSLPNLLFAVRRNAARGASRAFLFEIGASYDGDRPEDQRTVATGVLFGGAGKTWASAAQVPDVFAAKAAALTALEAAGVATDNLMVMAEGPAHFHPGRKGRLGLGPKKTLAVFGEIHPGTLRTLDVPGPVAAFEVFLDEIPVKKTKASTKPPLKVSSLMPVHRDFAFVVSRDTPAETLLRAVRGADKKLVSDVRLFDVYEGPGVPDGHKSLAVEITLQPFDNTLTDEEIDAVGAKIVAQAEKAAGATLRG